MVSQEEARAELGLLAASPEEVMAASEGELVSEQGPLSREEAEVLIGDIHEHVGSVRQKLLRLHDGHAWKALAYPTWDAMVADRFDMRRSTAYDTLSAARVERVIVRNFGQSNIPDSQLRALAPLKNEHLWEIAWRRVRAQANGDKITAVDVLRVVVEMKEEANREELILVEETVQPKKRGTAKLNRTNENVSWAWWTWNPVTGCLHDCPYCYARDIANRFYPEGFQPTFHPDRLAAPGNTPVPMDEEALSDARSRRIFTCSMADLFGKWVPQEWIDAVFEEIRGNPQWTFLCLTKFPQRLAEIEWPKNAWVGTTVDKQYRVAIAEKAFRGVKAGIKWLSCEPLLEPLKFSSLEMFDWVVIGGASKSSQTAASWPNFEWVVDLYNQARAAGCKIYFKPNTFSSETKAPKEEP